MPLAFPIVKSLVVILFSALIAACQHTAYPPRIDIEFEPGAPVVSDGAQFVADKASQSKFSHEEVGEQLAFINETLQETAIATIAPKTSNAVNRRYSIFVGSRMDRYALDSLVYRLQVSSLVASAMATENPAGMPMGD